MKKRTSKIIITLSILIALITLIGVRIYQVSHADPDGPRVGIAIKTVDESGNPVEGVTYEVNYLGETIEVGPSGTDGYARSANNAIKLFNTAGTPWQEEGITETTFGGNDLNLTAVTYPDQYEVLIPEQKHNNDYIDNIDRLTDNKIEINGSTWGGAISNRPTKETESGTFLDANDLFEEGEYFEYVHMLGKVEGSGMPVESIHLSFVAKEFEKPEQPATPYGELKIKKYKEGTTEPLAGAVYEVYFNSEEYYDTITLENGETKYTWNKITTITTGENGEATTGMILPKITNRGNKAKYYINEITAPVGYEIDNSNQYETYEIEEGQATEIIRYNKGKEYGEIKITKIRAGDDSILLPGAKFQVINASNSTITLKDGTQVARNGVATTITTDENGEARTGMILPVDGKYQLKETVFPEGYAIVFNPDMRFEPNLKTYNVEENQTTEIVARNVVDNGGLMILKQPSGFMSSDLIDKYKDVEFPVEILLKDQDGNPVNDEFYYNVSNLNYEPNQEWNNLPYDKRYSYIKDLDKIRFENGKATVNIILNGSIAIFEIPYDYYYEVRELEVDGWYLEHIGHTFYHNDSCYNMGTGLRLNNVSSGVIKDNGSYNGGTDLFTYPTYIRNMKLPDFGVIGKKEQIGRKLQKDEYSFEIKDRNQKVVGYTNIDENGNINFDQIAISPGMLNRNNINYLEATDEQKQRINNWISDDCYPHTQVRTVIPNNAYTSIHTANGYERVYYSDATEEQKKELRSWLYEDKSIYYYIYDKNVEGAFEAAAEYYNLGVLNAIEFSGDLEYTISEVLPDGVTKENPTKDGITYDTHEEKIILHVHGYHGEDFDIDVEYDEDGLVFVNKYNEEEEKIEFEVDTKPEKGTPKKEEVKNASSAKIPFTFDNIVKYFYGVGLSLIAVGIILIIIKRNKKSFN